MVRVVSEDARRPVLFIQRIEEGGSVSFVTMPGALSFDTPLELPKTGNALLALGVKDGNVKARSLSMTPVAAKPDVYRLTVTDKDKFGVDYTVEEMEVSFNTDATDDMGESIFILDRMHTTSTVLEAVYDAEVDRTGFTGFSKITLSGGTLGDQKVISVDQYGKALAILRGALVGYTAVLGLGCYDTTTIVALGDIARDRRVDAFIDLQPANTYARALTAAKALNLNNNDVCLYHFPYSAKDPHSGGRAIWGIKMLGIKYKESR